MQMQVSQEGPPQDEPGVRDRGPAQQTREQPRAGEEDSRQPKLRQRRHRHRRCHRPHRHRRLLSRPFIYHVVRHGHVADSDAAASPTTDTAPLKLAMGGQQSPVVAWEGAENQEEEEDDDDDDALVRAIQGQSARMHKVHFTIVQVRCLLRR